MGAKFCNVAKTMKITPHQFLIQNFIEQNGRKLVYVPASKQWMAKRGAGWVSISNRNVNQMLRLAGCHPGLATRTRRIYLEVALAYSGSFPKLEPKPLTPIAPILPEMIPFIEKYAAQLMYDQTTHWWRRMSGEHLFDSEINRLIRDTCGIRQVTGLRRDLENCLAFAVWPEKTI
jgi:hypothetical protein